MNMRRYHGMGHAIINRLTSQANSGVHIFWPIIKARQ
jgi:hypothetical protein